ncbi:WecB/TagA/CpsF family glycosyltransferase [Clostridium sp. UBA7503]|uniref:WecB/TagA/CpsF family glycosyltransferase n=1 Tax=Clostridium sp. UBA7503 TaxID=1946377 RepID=UPI003217E1E8
MREFFSRIYRGSKSEFYDDSYEALKLNKKMFVVTANPETLMIGKESDTFYDVLKSENTIIVPDGIGIIKGANYIGIPIRERITGVEYVSYLLETLNKLCKTLYLYGASQKTLNSLVEKIKTEYPDIDLVGYIDGYNKSDEDVHRDIIKLEPDVVLVALGIPKQELFIDGVYKNVKKGIFVGVGGAFDVISGCKKRAPEIFIKLNLEWLYRIGKEPKRIKRFYSSNIKYIKELARLKNGGHINENKGNDCIRNKTRNN